MLSPGQASDKAVAAIIIDELAAPSIVVGDRGYDARALLEQIEARGGTAHIPTQRDRKQQRSVDPALYGKRNLIERFFNRIKHCRRIATRFDKLATNFLAAVSLAATRLWLRTYESTT